MGEETKNKNLHRNRNGIKTKSMRRREKEPSETNEIIKKTNQIVVMYCGVACKHYM